MVCPVSKALQNKAAILCSSDEPMLPGCEGIRLSAQAGKVGLRNLGNTCFMNAGLQCLCHIEPFAAFFLSGRFEREVNSTNPLGNGGELAKAFADLMQLMWQSDRSTQDPRSIRRKLARIAPHLFEGYSQQDVHEFLAFCLDGLHEDLNRVHVRPPPPTDQEEAEFERAAASRGEEFAAALSWMRYLQRGKSFLVDLMQGQLRSVVTCTCCGYQSKRFEPFLYLSVPVWRGMRTVSDALSQYLQEEVLEGDEQWFCERCKQRVDALKKIDVWKLPTVLVLHLKRFEYDVRSGRFRKVDTKLAAGEQIDFTAYCSSDQRDGALFDVVGVANHIGPYGHGHYTATCRVGASDGVPSWYHFDDDRVTPVASGKDAIGRDAYVIFFVRRAREGGDDSDSADDNGMSNGVRGLVRRQTVRMPHLWPHRNSVVADLAADLEDARSCISSQSFAGERKACGRGSPEGRRGLAAPTGRSTPFAPHEEGPAAVATSGAMFRRRHHCARAVDGASPATLPACPQAADPSRYLSRETAQTATCEMPRRPPSPYVSPGRRMQTLFGLVKP